MMLVFFFCSVNGTTGESLNLTIEERKLLAEEWIKQAKGKWVVFVVMLYMEYMYMCMYMYMYMHVCTVRLEMLAGIKFGGCVQNCYCNRIGRYKFDSFVWDHVCENESTQHCKYWCTCIFNLVIAKKMPLNLISYQIFGIILTLDSDGLLTLE